MEQYSYECPDPTELADEMDDAGWDITKHGRMRDAAAPDDAVATVPYVPQEDAQ